MISLGEGKTPLVGLPRLAAALRLGALHAKLESCNPTGSYKDRIAARSMDEALARDAKGWIATSSGNGATSFAAYGRRAGLRGVLCVTDSIAREKLIPALALGARVIRVAGTGDAGGLDVERRLFEVVQTAAHEHGLYLGVTAHRFNDVGMRAVDSIAHEIAEAGEMPDAVYVPVGGGGLVAAVARGVLERGNGSAVVACQPEGCAPIARYLQGELPLPSVERCETSISGLQVPSAPDGELATRLVHRTGGWGVTATDAEILAAQRELCLSEGVFVEPAAACALAGLRSDLQAGRMPTGGSAVLVLTGSGLKTLAALEAGLEPPPVAAVDDLPALLGEAS